MSDARGVLSASMNNENTTPRKHRTPQIAKTAPLIRRREEEPAPVALDTEIADELLARIEGLEVENRKLRKIAQKGKGESGGKDRIGRSLFLGTGAVEALRTALAEAERQQRQATQWMAAAAAGQALLREAAGREKEAARQLQSEAERSERLLERTRQLEATVARHGAQVTIEHLVLR